MSDPSGRLITRQHVLDLLRMIPLDPEQRRSLLTLPYPVDYAVVVRRFAALGLSPEGLADRMGGSP